MTNPSFFRNWTNASFVFVNFPSSILKISCCECSSFCPSFILSNHVYQNTAEQHWTFHTIIYYEQQELIIFHCLYFMTNVYHNYKLSTINFLFLSCSLALLSNLFKIKIQNTCISHFKLSGEVWSFLQKFLTFNFGFYWLDNITKRVLFIRYWNNTSFVARTFVARNYLLKQFLWSYLRCILPIQYSLFSYHNISIASIATLNKITFKVMLRQTKFSTFCDIQNKNEIFRMYKNSSCLFGKTSNKTKWSRFIARP